MFVCPEVIVAAAGGEYYLEELLYLYGFKFK